MNGNFSKNSNKIPQKGVQKRIDSHSQFTSPLPFFRPSEQSTARMMVHDCDEVRNLQRQIAKSEIIFNQGTRDILAPLSEKRNERAETDRVPQIITLQDRSFKWSCTARVDSHTSKTTVDEMTLANALIDWCIDFPTARDRGPYHEDDASDISEESEDDDAYSYLWSYDD
jgi:hypothetical protein